MKVLNLYACLGGNRLKWADCEVTAVELDPELARMYQERFPGDKVVIADAHQYLLDHYKEFDFIWTSTPCPTHSKPRFWSSKGGKCEPMYPDMKLYQEIIFLTHWFDGKWVAENVDPYYEALFNPTKIGRHLFWSNFVLGGPGELKEANCRSEKIHELELLHKIDVSSYKGEQRKDKILRNLVHYDTGAHIFNLAKGIHTHNNQKQGDLFK